MGVPLTSNHL